MEAAVMPVQPNLQASLRQLVASLAVLTLLSFPAHLIADPYRLAPGDILHVMIVGKPELTVEIPIEMDGSAWFPLIGTITAGGATLDEVRRQTADAYAKTSLERTASPDGALSPVIDTKEVYVSVATYRPILVVNDVTGAREVPFRIGLTLHHLLALATTVPQRDGVPQVALSQVEAAATALAHEYAQIWRYKSFLGIDDPKDYAQIFVTQKDDVEDIVAVERSILKETIAGIEAQKQSIRAEISRIESRADVLSRQRENESEGLAIDEQDLADVQSLFTRGLVPASRLTEVRRSTLVTASRVFQIDVAFENALGQAASYKADINKIEGDARVRAWQELGGAVSRVQERRSRYEALVANSGGSLPTLSSQTQTSVTVTRAGVTIPAAEISRSMLMLPGDFVEIRGSSPVADVDMSQQEAAD